METPPPSPGPQGSSYIQDDCSDEYGTPTRHHASILLREQEKERERLRMDNFNQALRINYLEEQLLRFNQGLGFGSEDLESEMIQLRLLLDERERDLQQRNFSMIRATEAMDLLSNRLQEAQDQVKHAQGQVQAQRQQFRHEQRDLEAKLTEKWQSQVEDARKREAESQDTMQMLQEQLERQEQVVQTFMTQLEEMKDAKRRQESEMTQCQRQREQEAQEKMEMIRTELEAEIKHWKAVSTEREEEMTALQLQMETMRQQLVGEMENLRLQNAKLLADSAEQTKAIDSFKADRPVALDTIKQLESQLHQLRMLEKEHEFTIKTLESRLQHAELTEKSRHAMVNDNMKQERERLKADFERIAKERQQFVGETERLRLENVKLTTAYEELMKSLDGIKTDREVAVETIRQLESKLRCQYTSNERLLALEKDRRAMEEDNCRLREELSGFQMELEAMEHKLQASEKRFSSEAANAQEQCHRLSVCQVDLERQSAQLQEYQKQLAGCETELARRARRMQDLERQLAEAEGVAREQLREWQDQFVAEKSKLLRQLSDERRRANEVERAATTLKNENTSAQQELKTVEMELRSLLSGCTPVYSDRRHQTLVSLVREAIFALKNDFKAEATAMQTCWKQHTLMMNSKLERLATQLRSSQSKLGALQCHEKDAKQSAEKTWSIRYEDLRMRKEEERQSLEEEIRYFKTKMTKAEEALARANRNIQALKLRPREEAQHDVDALKESNRLLFEEVQERRKSVEHARNQYRQAVRENKDLLKAIATYKDAIAGRDKDIEKFKSAAMKYAQQLKRRGEFGEVEKTLLVQLEQTQHMITETYKRLENSSIVRGSVVNASDKEERLEVAILQLDALVGRMHAVSERWGDFLTQSQELQRQYGKTNSWESVSRGSGRTKDQPRWVDDVDQKCSRLLTEAVRISEAMHDVVNNIVGVFQKEQSEKKCVKKEGVDLGDKNASVKQRDDTSSAWLPRDNDYFDGKLRSQSVSQRHFESPTKQNGFDASCRNPTASASSRCSVNKRYGGSLSSLIRVGMKVQELETEIRRAHD